jgi:hypothetical protein
MPERKLAENSDKRSIERCSWKQRIAWMVACGDLGYLQIPKQTDEDNGAI